MLFRLSKANVLLDIFHILFGEGWWFAVEGAAQASFRNDVVSYIIIITSYRRECRRV